MLSHAFSFSADLQRLQQLVPRISVLPLGCGALAGNPFVVDRELLARELGFHSVAENSLYGVGDRDFIVEFMMWASLAMTHVSRMAEDLVIYSTAEFGFVTLSDAYRRVYTCVSLRTAIANMRLQHWIEYHATKEEPGFPRAAPGQVWTCVWERECAASVRIRGLVLRRYRWQGSS